MPEGRCVFSTDFQAFWLVCPVLPTSFALPESHSVSILAHDPHRTGAPKPEETKGRWHLSWICLPRRLSPAMTSL